VYICLQGRNIIGWDEILEGGIPDEAIVMSWRGTIGGVAAAKHKHQVIMTPNTRCYFDYRQSGSMQVCLFVNKHQVLAV
jgi:hexosaminidase